MADIIQLDLFTKTDISPDRVLEAAAGKLDKVVICGHDKDGEIYFASSTADGPSVLWLLERCKRDLLDIKGD